MSGSAVAAEITPLSAKPRLPLAVERAHVPDPVLKVRVTPAAGWLRFYFDVGEIRNLVTQADHDARVVERGRLGTPGGCAEAVS